MGASLDESKGFVEEEKVKVTAEPDEAKGFCETLGAFADAEEALSKLLERVK